MLFRLFLSLPKARRWVEQTIAEHRAAAKPLTDYPFTRLRSYFPWRILSQTQIVVVSETPRPPLEQWGLHAADDFAMFEAAGMTLQNVILIRSGGEHDESLVFHELIHVLQWELLGAKAFLALYGIQLLELGYADNAMETMAYELQGWFDDKRRPFDAAAIVQRRVQETLSLFRKQSMLHRLAVVIARPRRSHMVND